MGGGDLNTKKSWHPNTIKNQEKVWKAEQAEANEKRRIDDLRREIDRERNKEELIQHGQTSGVLAERGSKKMDWMYKQPNESVDREQYLLGKKVDKVFESVAASEKSSQAKVAPKNHVEHECIPFSIRNLSNDTTSREFQVDMARKMMEDPLVAIKKKELESRAQLLQNPVKLKELTMLLQNEKLRGKKRKDKKKKKCKDSLDKKLAEKLSKLKGSSSKNIDLNELLTSHKSKKKAKRRSPSSSSNDSSSESEDESDKDRRRKRKYDGREAKSERHRRDERNDDKRKLKESHDRECSSNKIRKKHDSDSSDEDRAKKRNYGLVSGDGTPMALKKNQSESHKKPSVPVKTSKPIERTHNRTRLSEEEKERKRREMMQNAVVRDKERETKVKHYKEREKLVEEKEKKLQYREDFVEKHLRESSKHLSVESRLKSNVYNIQRSSKHMDSNFAKR